MFALGAVLMGVSVLWPDGFVATIIGKSGFGNYAPVIVFYVISIALSLVVIALLKSMHKPNIATSITLCAHVIIPFVVLIQSESLLSYMTNVGIGLLIIIILCLAYTTRELLIVSPSIKNLFLRASAFFSYGAKGAGVEFSFMFYLWLPPLIISSSDDLTIAGYFSLMLSLVLAASSPVAPIASIMMTKMAKLLKSESKHELISYFWQMSGIILMISVPAFGVSLLFYDDIVHYILKESEPIGIKASVVMLTAILPISIYLGFRNMVDLLRSPVVNIVHFALVILLFTLVVQVSRSYGYTTRVATVSGFVCAAWLLGVLTYVRVAGIIFKSVRRLEN